MQRCTQYLGGEERKMKKYMRRKDKQNKDKGKKNKKNTKVRDDQERRGPPVHRRAH